LIESLKKFNIYPMWFTFEFEGAKKIFSS